MNGERLTTTFKGTDISQSEVIRALREFMEMYPDPNQYENWMEKDNYKYAIDYEGRLYPPKHILSRVSGVSTQEFSGGEQTNRVFEQLGFEIVRR